MKTLLIVAGLCLVLLFAQAEWTWIEDSEDGAATLAAPTCSDSNAILTTQQPTATCANNLLVKGTKCVNKCKTDYTDTDTQCVFSGLALYGKGCCCTIFGCCNICSGDYYDEGCLCRRKAGTTNSYALTVAGSATLVCPDGFSLSNDVCYKCTKPQVSSDPFIIGVRQNVGYVYAGTTKWLPIAGEIAQVSVCGVGLAYGIDTKGQLFKLDSNAENWVPFLTGNYKHVSCYLGEVTLVDLNGNPYQVVNGALSSLPYLSGVKFDQVTGKGLYIFGMVKPSSFYIVSSYKWKPYLSFSEPVKNIFMVSTSSPAAVTTSQRVWTASGTWSATPGLPAALYGAQGRSYLYILNSAGTIYNTKTKTLYEGRTFDTFGAY